MSSDEIPPHMVANAHAMLETHVPTAARGTKPPQCVVERCGRWPCRERHYARWILALAHEPFTDQPAADASVDGPTALDT